MLTKFSGKYSFVIDGLLGEGHDIVDILRGGNPCLLALLVEPEVGARGRAAHVGTRRHCAELRYGAVHEVDVREEVDSCDKAKFQIRRFEKISSS